MEFRATVELNGRTATGIHVPDEVITALATGRRPAVRATVNGYTYRSTVASMGGRFMLPVSAEHRAGAGVAAGESVIVVLERDDEPRRVTVPPELAAALEGDPRAKLRFESLSYSAVAPRARRGRREDRRDPAAAAGEGARRASRRHDRMICSGTAERKFAQDGEGVAGGLGVRDLIVGRFLGVGDGDVSGRDRGDSRIPASS